MNHINNKGVCVIGMVLLDFVKRTKDCWVRSFVLITNLITPAVKPFNTHLNQKRYFVEE